MLDSKLKKYIKITVADEDEQLKIGNSIHEQLRGNKDYMDSNIVLNLDTKNEINLYIFKECNSEPTIII